MEEFEKASCIWGFHVYQDNWTPILDKRLACKNEPGNPRDWYAVTVCKAGDEIVGHLPRNISIMHSIFIRRGGIIYWKLAGKLLQLEANLWKPWKFSTANDLHYMISLTTIVLNSRDRHEKKQPNFMHLKLHSNKPD